MKKIEYLSLEELRADKAKLGRRLRAELKGVQQDAVELVMPQQTMQFVNSSVPYARYIGYGLTAWRTFNTVRKVLMFVKTRKWK